MFAPLPNTLLPSPLKYALNTIRLSTTVHIWPVFPLCCVCFVTHAIARWIILPCYRALRKENLHVSEPAAFPTEPAATHLPATGWSPSSTEKSGGPTQSISVAGARANATTTATTPCPGGKPRHAGPATPAQG